MYCLASSSLFSLWPPPPTPLPVGCDTSSPNPKLCVLLIPLYCLGPSSPEVIMWHEQDWSLDWNACWLTKRTSGSLHFSLFQSLLLLCCFWEFELQNRWLAPAILEGHPCSGGREVALWWGSPRGSQWQKEGSQTIHNTWGLRRCLKEPPCPTFYTSLPLLMDCYSSVFLRPSLPPWIVTPFPCW